MEAVERARAARGAERIAAAEEALMLSVPELLPGAYVERTVIGKKIELYRWLAEPHWERASRRLEALSREVMGLLARAYLRRGAACRRACHVRARVRRRSPGSGRSRRPAGSRGRHRRCGATP